MHFRWRDNPGVLARYMMDGDVPAKAEVTLKPNEICVVLEDGKIVGSVSQQHLEVNPQVGLIGKLFGKKNPRRSFMFCFTGPHEILVMVKGHASGGEEYNCMVALKVEIIRESAPRLLNFAARGINTVHSSDIANHLSQSVQSATKEILKSVDAENLKTAACNEDLIFHIKTQIRTNLDEAGLKYQNAYIIWSASAAEQRLQRQQELERIAVEKEHISERQELELNHLVQSEQRRWELKARMALVGVQAQEKANMALELERINNSGTIEFETWNQANRLQQAKNQQGRDGAILDAETNRDIAHLDADGKRAAVAVDMEVSEHKTKQAMDLFEQVQKKKQERMQMNAEQEQQRLQQHSEGSQSAIKVLENIASTATDPMVQMEALKQLAELRKADVSGQKDAYKD